MRKFVPNEEGRPFRVEGIGHCPCASQGRQYGRKNLPGAQMTLRVASLQPGKRKSLPGSMAFLPEFTSRAAKSSSKAISSSRLTRHSHNYPWHRLRPGWTC